MKKVKLIICSLILALLSTTVIGMSSSQVQKAEAAWSGWGYNPGWRAGGASSVGSACSILKSEGFTAVAAAGIIGNFMAESGMNPYVREGIGNHATYPNRALADRLDPDYDTYGPGRGLAQWGDGTGLNGLGGSRWLVLVRYVNNRFGKSYPLAPTASWSDRVNNNESTVRSQWPTLEEQLTFVKKELADGDQGISFAEYNRATTPESAAYILAARYEKPAGLSGSRALRESEARKAYERHCKNASDASQGPLTNGMYIRVVETGSVYVLVGGAPLVVTDWANVGGVKQYRDVSLAQFNGFAKYPADGTFISGTDGTAYVFAGGAPLAITDWANVGGARPTIKVDGVTISNAGGADNFSNMRRTPVDGTVITGTDGTAYVFAGGAPLVVTDWANIGGARPSTKVDGVTISNAGGSGYFSNMRRTPADGTYITGTDGTAYVFAGGAPLVITNWANVGGAKPTTKVDGVTISNAGGTGYFSNMRRTPSDGTYITGTDGTAYVFAGGAPLAITNWANVGGAKPTIKVDGVTISNAGGTGYFSNMRRTPSDGTYITGTDGTAYVFAGGAPLAITNWANVGGVKPTTKVDGVTISSAGGTGYFSNMRRTPADGTYVTSTDGTVYVFAGGAALAVSNWANVGGIKPTTKVDRVTLANAGGAGYWSNVRKKPQDGTILKSGNTTVYYVVQGGVARTTTTTSGSTQVDPAAIAKLV